MSRLEELINELCPDGVEYKTVGEVCTIKKGVQLNKDKLKDNGLYPVINGGVNPSGYWDEYNFNANLITISQGGASAGYVNFMTTPFWAGAHCYVIEKCDECLNYLYLYHFIKMHQKTFMQCQYGAGIPSLNLKSINSISIPLPPLSIQSEIVHILDSFTLLTAELTAELTARQKQYAFYRDYLLDFSDEDVTKKIPDIDCSNVEYKRLGDIAKFTYGYTDKAKDYGDTRFIRITDILDNGYLNPSDAKYININEESKKYLLSKGDLLLARTGATYGKTLYVPDDEKAVYASFLIKIELDNTKILNRYYWHFSKSNLYWKQANKLVSTAGQPQFNTNAVSRVVIPVPPLSVQENIVKILDRFDKLNNDMSEGLPAEIEARKKQYEYYRDTLLSFDDKACSHIVKVERERES